VADYLVGKFHIDLTRLEPVGMGQDGLMVPTADQTPESRNRRVLVVNIGTQS
jgi:outer membrane protein OmpA-like peptidoglycan-associated protein